MDQGATGLFGKLPAHGDFVRRGLPRSFIAPWDDWLSDGIAVAREALGPAWEAAWEEAPPWRFRLAPGVCGPDAAVGVVVTSADTVGRRFPLTLAAVLPGACVPPPEAWFAALEEAALRGRDGEMDADRLLALLPPPPPEDPDATLDGRSLFWTAAGVSMRMPRADDFATLLAAPPALEPVDEVPEVALLAAEVLDPDAVPGTEVVFDDVLKQIDAALDETAWQDLVAEDVVAAEPVSGESMPEDLFPADDMASRSIPDPPSDADPLSEDVAVDDPGATEALPFALLPFAPLPFDGPEQDGLPFAALPFEAMDPPPDSELAAMIPDMDGKDEGAPYQWAEAVDLPWATTPQPRDPEAGADA